MQPPADHSFTPSPLFWVSRNLLFLIFFWCQELFIGHSEEPVVFLPPPKTIGDLPLFLGLPSSVLRPLDYPPPSPDTFSLRRGLARPSFLVFQSVVSRMRRGVLNSDPSPPYALDPRLGVTVFRTSYPHHPSPLFERIGKGRHSRSPRSLPFAQIFLPDVRRAFGLDLALMRADSPPGLDLSLGGEGPCPWIPPNRPATDKPSSLFSFLQE